MGQVTVTLNGRTYRLGCGDGEEARLLELANHLRQRVDGLAADFGQVGDDRLLIMAALLITDELLDLRSRLAPAAQGEFQLEAEAHPQPQPIEAPASPPPLPPAPDVQEPARPTLRRPVAR